MNSRAQNAPGVTGEGHGRAREPGWYPFATPEEIQEHERLRAELRAAQWRVVELEHEVKQTHRAGEALDAENQRTLDEVAGLVRPGEVLDEPALLEAVQRLAEHARAAYWLAAWRGISHDHVAGIVGGLLLGSGVDVLERIHRHTRAALDRAGR